VPGADTPYVPNDTSGTGGVRKFFLVGGTGTAVGTFSTGLATAGDLTGCSKADDNVQLFVTNGVSLSSLEDSTAYNASITGTTGTLTSLLSASASRCSPRWRSRPTPRRMGKPSGL